MYRTLFGTGGGERRYQLKHLYIMKTKNVLFVLVCTLLSVHVKAANGDIFTTNTSEGVTMTFKIISEVDRTVQVGSGSAICCNTEGSVTIPETVTYSGVVYSVISIGAWAFDYSCVRKVTIPNSITSIGFMAFNYCVFLTSITIPSSVTSIGTNAFSQCSSLSSVTSKIETPFAFNSGAFSGISSYCKLTVPYGKKSAYIAAGWTESVFKGGIAESPKPVITFADTNVKAICVANWDTDKDGELSEDEAAAVTDLGEVFRGNTEIMSFDELQCFTGLISIGDYAFQSCSGLTSVTFPNSLTSIGGGAFCYCI